MSQASLLHQLNFLAAQSIYANKVYTPLQAPFSLDNVMGTSMEMAMENCQRLFKWERWNCPTSDFLLRRSSPSAELDREGAFVEAIATAALIYTTTKNCSSGITAGCGSCSDNPYTTICSDNPKEAEELLRKHSDINFAKDFKGKIESHNYKVITNLLEKSLTNQCVCAIMGPGGNCAKEICRLVLKPFEEIANDIRQMYDEGILLENTIINSRVLWNNIPLDALVFMKDSPNYCELDAVPHWNGMVGRQCASGASEEDLSDEDRERCGYLCRECGYTVEEKTALTETRCNCKLTWDFQLQCDSCIIAEKHHYCY
ncbi:wnt inhibitor of Dorsal protein-like [Musca vetustissima]|uniref:wnt inhibitor of Dorsal protein-like n=1 Tax=Musca vetustissima TaxID=27455 RepID=UPI002AB643C0|nr:wnt inhibitor of Dorsal protein-like [Musca vetustissima]